MGSCDNNFLCTLVHEDLHSTSNGAAGVNHVVNQHTGTTLDVTHNSLRNSMVGDVNVAGLVHERQGCAVQQISPVLSHADTTGIRGHNGHVGQVFHALADVLSQNRNREEVIQRAVEEALNLRSVQIHAHQAVSTSGLVQIRNQTCRDRLTTLVLLVLTSIGVERRHHGNRASRCTLECINHNELLHEPFVDRCRVRLNHESVRTAHRLLKTDVGLAIGEGVCGGGQQVVVKSLCDLLGKLGVCSTGDHYKLALTGVGNLATHGVVLSSN